MNQRSVVRSVEVELARAKRTHHRVEDAELQRRQGADHDLSGPAAGCCIARSGKIHRARSRPYRGQILQVNMRWKALAEIYAMPAFAPWKCMDSFEKWPRAARKIFQFFSKFKQIFAGFRPNFAGFLPNFPN